MKRSMTPRLRGKFWVLGWSLALTLILGGAPRPASAAEPPPLSPQVSIVFGEAVTILLPLADLGPVRRIEIYVRPEGQETTYTQDMLLDETLARYEHSVAEKPLPLFGQVYYWFKIHPAQGAAYLSPAFTFIYEDNRFPWQARTDPPVTVYWYEGGAVLADEALNAAQQTLEHARIRWGGRLAPDARVRIYIYASAKALNSALDTLPPEMRTPEFQWPRHVVWAYGDGDPRERLALQRQIAHHVAHIVLYDTAAKGFAFLPWWFREGLAGLAEPWPDPQALGTLYHAVAANQMFSLRELCVAPPVATPEDELLARAEARAFATYLFARYGPTGLERLLEIYLSGLGCEEGVPVALGADLASLEQAWRVAQGLVPRQGLGPGWTGLWVAVWLVVPSLVLGAWYWRTRRLDEDFAL